MREYIEKLQELKTLRKEINAINTRIDAIAKPKLSDYGYLPFLHKVFLDVTNGDDRDPEIRGLFLLLVAYFYSPHALAGMKCKKHYRRNISTLFSFLSPCTISLNTSTAVFQYLHYKQYRTFADNVFSKILDVIKDEDPELYDLINQ